MINQPKRRILAILISFAMLISLLPAGISPVKAEADTWNGTADTVWYTSNTTATSFTIDTAEELAGLASICNAGTDSFAGDTITLTVDLVLSGYSWTPISNTNAVPCVKFAGIFDGAGHIITGLYINASGFSGGQTCGLFGYADTSANIKDIILINVNITNGKAYCGGICGYNSGIISGCSVSGSVFGNTDGTSNGYGGIAGINTGIINNCRNSASVTCTLTAGGIAGENSAGRIYNCYNTGYIKSTTQTAWSGYSDSGGIIGTNHDNGTIANCYNLGTVEAYNGAGGIVSWNQSGSTITNCYSSANVISTSNSANAAGLAEMNEGTFQFSYWNSDLFTGSGFAESALPVTCFSQTTAFIKSSSFISLLNDNKGTYSSWGMGSDGYPTFVTLAPEMNVQGNSITIVDGDSAPSLTDNTDFGSISVSSSAVLKPFTIQNTGTADLLLSSISISGTNASDFIVSTSPAATIYAGSSTTFQITFNPSALGFRSAEVSIYSNDSDENPYNFAIQGTGINITPTVGTPSTVSYSDTADNDTFDKVTDWLSVSDDGDIVSYGISEGISCSEVIDSITYTIKKEGSYGTLYVESTGIGTGAYVFVPNSTVINSLSSNNSETYTVTATDDFDAVGTATFTVSITGVNDTPSDISLSGTSIDQSDGTNAEVGILSTTDRDSGQTYTYSLVGGGDNDYFNISGSSLRANNASTMAARTYNVNIRTTDNSTGSLTYDEIFVITVVDNIAPVVNSVSVPANGTYVAGQNLDFTVIYNEAVTLNTTGGTPYISLTIGADTCHAAYLSGNGTSGLVFRYTVQTGDGNFNGIGSAISLNGATMRDAAGNNAVLTLNNVSSIAGIYIDAISPIVSSIVKHTPSNSVTNASSVIYRITFSENVTGVDISDFYLTKTDSADGTVASVTSVSSAVYDVTVNTITGNGTLRLDLNSSGTGIQDAVGNAINGGFTTGETYTIDTTAPIITGVSHSGLYNITVSPTFTEGTATLAKDSDAPLAYTSATAISAEGSYVLTLTDNAGNSTTVSFVIDKTSPAVGGVTNNTKYSVSVVGTFTEGSATLTKNGGTATAYLSGVSVADEGNYILVVTDEAGNSTTINFTIDKTQPYVESVNVPVIGTYNESENLDFTVYFSETVTVTGTPKIQLTVGSNVYANYLSGNGTSALVFRYVIPTGVETDSITVNGWDLSSGTIRDIAGNDTTNTMNGVDPTTGIKVDSMLPYVISVNRYTPLSDTTNATSIVFSVTFSENVTGLDISDFTLTKTGTAQGSISSVSASNGTTINVTVINVSGEGTIRLDLKSSGTSIQDNGGNDIPTGFTTGQVYNISTPTVTLSVDSANITENGAVATITATLSVAVSEDVVVTLGYSGSATGTGTDYTASSASITVTGGNTTGTATITSVNDTTDEYDETVIADITGVTNGVENGTQQVTVTITDDDAEPSLSVNDPSVTEGDSGTKNLSFTVTLSAASGKTVTADYATSNGTAIAGTDYTSATGTLTFNPGETSKTVSLTVNGDDVTESDETLLLTLSNLGNATISDAQGTGTITNDDAVPEITINDMTAAEGNAGTSTMAFTVSLDHASAFTVTVNYATADNTAVFGSDYAALSGTLAFSPGETSKTITVTINGDINYEPDESYYVNLSSPVNSTIADNRGIGTITNDDAVPTVTLSVDDTTIDEAAGVATVTATLSALSTQDITVTIGYTGSATGAGTDYTASSSTITIPAGTLTGTVTVTAVQDVLDEIDETVIADITGVTNGVENGTQQVTVTITDDDAEPSLSVNDPSVTEGASGTKNLSFTVTLSAASGKTVTADYATSNGTAIAGTDYTSATGTLTFNPGETSKTVSLTVNGDDVTESDETLLLTLSNPGNATISDAQGTGTITNDDAVPEITINDMTAAEGNAGTSTMAFTVSLDHASAFTVTVNYATADNTAVFGSDYAALSGTLAFSPGETSKTITVTVNGDINYEPSESYYVNLSSPVNSTISDNRGIGTITNDDALPSVTLSVDNTAIDEASGISTVTATLSVLSIDDVTVTLGYTGTATGAGTDYTASSSTITIPAGTLTGTVTVTAVQDALDEYDETVIVDITGVTNGTENGTQQITVIITDDDAEPTLRVNDASVIEGYSGTVIMTFTVTLSQLSGKFVTVVYDTLGGTALAETDYTAVNGTLIFELGQTTKTVNISVNGDDEIEAHETVLFNLSGSVNAAISDASGTGIIYDDDEEPAPDDDTDAVVEVNGERQDAGQISTDTVDNRTVATITVDNEKLNEILDIKGDNATVTLPVDTKTDDVVGELNGQTVKNMENKTAILEIETQNVKYTLPASQIDIDSVSSSFGSQVSLEEIKVKIKISEPSSDTVQVVEDTANEGGYQIVVQPVDFEITCSYEDKTVEVQKFSAYVERIIAIPEGVDPSKITTGIILNDDGTFRHVPTTIIVIEGRYYAKINSLTNSTYSIIYNTVEFADVSPDHWAYGSITDMAARLILPGTGENEFNPEGRITRAEFACAIVNALGLAQDTGKSMYSDVKDTYWFKGYINTATEYSLINGYDNISFGPYDLLTREQAMTIITRAMKMTGLNAVLTDNEIYRLMSRYADRADVSGYAKESIATCLKEGIINGTAIGILSPKSYTTRAEAAVMIQRLLEKSELIN